jgi:cell division protein FtsB
MMAAENVSKFIDMIIKNSSVLVIPLILWGVKLEVNNAVRDQQITQLEKEMENLNQIDEAVQEYAVELGKVDQRLESMDATVSEIRQDIKDLLRREQ